jgi:hypothetical protein
MMISSLGGKLFSTSSFTLQRTGIGQACHGVDYSGGSGEEVYSTELMKVVEGWKEKKM